MRKVEFKGEEDRKEKKHEPSLYFRLQGSTS